MTRCLLHNDPTTLFFQLKLKPIGEGVDTSKMFIKTLEVILNYSGLNRAIVERIRLEAKRSNHDQVDVNFKG